MQFETQEVSQERTISASSESSLVSEALAELSQGFGRNKQDVLGNTGASNMNDLLGNIELFDSSNALINLQDKNGSRLDVDTDKRTASVDIRPSSSTRVAGELSEDHAKVDVTGLSGERVIAEANSDGGSINVGDGKRGAGVQLKDGTLAGTVGTEGGNAVFTASENGVFGLATTKDGFGATFNSDGDNTSVGLKVGDHGGAGVNVTDDKVTVNLDDLFGISGTVSI